MRLCYSCWKPRTDQVQSRQRCRNWKTPSMLWTPPKRALPFLSGFLSSVSGRDITPVSRDALQRVWSISVHNSDTPRCYVAPLQNPLLCVAQAHAVWHSALCQKGCAKVLIVELIHSEHVPGGKAAMWEGKPSFMYRKQLFFKPWGIKQPPRVEVSTPPRFCFTDMTLHTSYLSYS